MMTIKQRLDTLRKEMKTFGIDAFIIPANDPHQSEYVADCWSNRTYFSGFTGSAGLLVVLQNYAALWTDSRYFLQAETELIDTGITLHKQQVQHAPEHVNWLEGILEHNSNVGVEASLFSVKQIAFMQSNFEDKNIKIKNVEGLTNKVWIDRPPLPDSIAYEHEIKYTGQSRDDKIAKIRHYMGSVGAQHYFVSALDEIAWLLNIRAWDIDFTPVALSYLLVSETNVYWFVQDFKVSDQLKVILSNSNVEILDYYAIADFLGNLSINDTLYVDGAHLSWNFHSIIKCNITIGQSAIMPLMAIKNKTEIAHFKDVMVKDGIALTHFFKWLEETVEKQAIRETEVAEKLTFFRSQQFDCSLSS